MTTETGNEQLMINIDLIKRETLLDNINVSTQTEYYDIESGRYWDNFTTESCKLEENHLNDSSDENEGQLATKEKNKVNDCGKKSNLLKNKFICEICCQSFTKRHTFEAHTRKHNGLNAWECQVCGEARSGYSSLKHHMAAIHPEMCSQKKVYICGINDCGKVSPTKAALKKHMFQVHIRDKSNKNNYHICDQCGKTFTSVHGLKKHSYLHSGVKPFKCHLCPKTYTDSTRLKLHIMEHDGIRNHICSICGVSKKTMFELRRHTNFHTKEKQYPCKLCSTVLYTVGNLTQHMKIKHYGIKAFKCKYCDRSFGKSEALKHHERTHTGEKPHVCPCGKRFIQSTALKTHLRTHNKNSA